MVFPFSKAKDVIFTVFLFCANAIITNYLVLKLRICAHSEKNLFSVVLTFILKMAGMFSLGSKC